MVNMCRQQGAQQCKLVVGFLCKFYISTVYTSFRVKRGLSLEDRILINYIKIELGIYRGNIYLFR